MAKLKRESAGLYRTQDGRFSVEQSSGRWMVVDAEQTDELGLALVRGPFGTLDEARAAIDAARTEPRPTSTLAERIAALPPETRKAAERSSRSSEARAERQTGKTQPPEPLPIRDREYRSGDGDRLRDLWRSVGFKSLGDDDASLDRMAHRNPGLLLVALAGDEIVASALGGWDCRRGWIYHVAVVPDHRRKGIATRLVRRLEEGFRALKSPKVSVIVRDGREARKFWSAIGYAQAEARQFGKELRAG